MATHINLRDRPVKDNTVKNVIKDYDKDFITDHSIRSLHSSTSQSYFYGIFESGVLNNQSRRHTERGHSPYDQVNCRLNLPYDAINNRNIRGRLEYNFYSWNNMTRPLPEIIRNEKGRTSLAPIIYDEISNQSLPADETSRLTSAQLRYLEQKCNESIIRQDPNNENELYDATIHALTMMPNASGLFPNLLG